VSLLVLESINGALSQPPPPALRCRLMLGGWMCVLMAAMGYVLQCAAGGPAVGALPTLFSRHLPPLRLADGGARLTDGLHYSRLRFHTHGPR
jgi:hypothetical protein